MSDLVLYKDAELSEPFIIESIGKVEAGDTKMVRGYLRNETPFDIEQIKYETGDTDLFIRNLPDIIMGESHAEILVGFSPKKARETALNSFITIKGKKIIPPE